MPTTLTQTEKINLREKGYSVADLREIKDSIKCTTYHLIHPNGKREEISETKAIELLGREEWLKGLSRSAFYTETNRWGLNGERINMHTRNYSR